MPIRRFNSCPRCGSPLTSTQSWAGSPSTFWKECTKCNTFVDTYIPLPHQEAVHKDRHKLIGNFGGYGTGKSLTDYKDLEKHILITPNADAMVTANISYQYEQTIKKELEKDLPAAFVSDYSVKNQRMELLNGAILSYRPLDDPNKLRSNNLTYWLIIEGSETNAESFHQLKTRLRNTAACTMQTDEKGNIVYNYDAHGNEIPIIEHDWRKGIVESNPDAGWIRTDLLLCSAKIYQHGKNNDKYEQDPVEIDPLISSHIATTDVNTYLPPDYINMICKNKPEWWVNRYVRSSFLYAEGLVYPNAMNCVVPWFEIPKTWRRIVAFDYGLSDDAVYIFGAVDEQAGILYIYKEVVMHDLNIEKLAARFKEETADIPIGGWITQPIIDPKSNKRDFNQKDLASHFAEFGIIFKNGHIGLDARILRLNTYFEARRILIMDNCVYTIKQFKEYKFEEKTLDNRKREVKPVDKNNHAINPVEWIAMELPNNPANLVYGVYTKTGFKVDELLKQKAETPWQLRDNDIETDYEYQFEVPQIEF